MVIKFFRVALEIKQNGISERKNRTMMEMAKCILFEYMYNKGCLKKMKPFEA